MVHRKLLRYCCVITAVLFLILFYIPSYKPPNKDSALGDSGFIIGWTTNTSRDLKLYVVPGNNTALISPTHLCNDERFLVLIIVSSAVVNFEERLAIRKTWGQSPEITDMKSVKLAFMLGEHENDTIQDQVTYESDIYNDIIQEKFIDSYNNLTIKTVMMLKWVTRNCPNLDYLLKLDDDMYLNVPALVKHLNSKKIQLEGKLICRAKPILDPTNKWFTTKYMYSHRLYPNYLSGTGYVMSINVAHQLYQVALKTPLFHLEDVFITGICANKRGIRPKDDMRFEYEKRPLDPCLLVSDTVITSHHMNASELFRAWAAIGQVTNETCEAIRKAKALRSTTPAPQIAHKYKYTYKCV